MKYKIILSTIVLVFSFVFVNAQDVKDKIKDESVVSTRSWKKGDEKITEQTLRFDLSTRGQKYEQDIISQSGNTYRLTIAPNVMVDEKGTHWKVELRNISSDERRDLVGVNPPCETGGDYFPREDLIGYYYADKLSKFTLNGVYVVESSLKPVYPIETVRKIKIEGFWVTLKAENIKEKENGGKSFGLIVEFTNDVEKSKKENL